VKMRGEDPAGTSVLSVIRNPFAHALSIYRFWRSDALSEHEKRLPLVHYARHLGFREFLFEVIRIDEFARMLLVNDVLPANVHVMRLEQLEDDARRLLLDLCGIRTEGRMPQRQRTDDARPVDPGPGEKDVMEWYDSETEQWIRKKYRWCFETGFYV
jgi:hypothetical protein